MRTSPADRPRPPHRRNPWIVALLAVVCALIAAMWVYAFGFASKEAINKVGDRAWAERGERICADARQQLIDLAVFEYVDTPTADDMRRRAELVTRSTDILHTMIDDVVAVLPTDGKGRDIVPLWYEDYRTYLDDRRDYAANLTSGDNAPFAESQVDGIPISEKLETFASDNEMDSCAPPHDLST